MILIHFNAANRSVSLRPAGPGCYVRELKWNIDLITRAGASLNESPSLSRTAEKVSLIFWRPFLVVTFNKFISVACGPLYLALSGPFLTRTFNSCHYQWSLLPRDGVLLAACLPPGPGVRGGLRRLCEPYHKESIVVDKWIRTLVHRRNRHWKLETAHRIMERLAKHAQREATTMNIMNINVDTHHDSFRLTQANLAYYQSVKLKQTKF